jgi:hypothetical protein
MRSSGILAKRRTSSGFPAIAIVPVPGDQLAMPPENRIRSHHGGQLLDQHLPPEDLAFYSQAPPLVVVEQDLFLSKLLSEDPILRQEILDDILLSAIDPAGQDQEKQLPWLKLALHVPPDAHLGTEASGIISALLEASLLASPPSEDTPL